jgi:hypothetical protein
MLGIESVGEKERKKYERVREGKIQMKRTRNTTKINLMLDRSTRSNGVLIDENVGGLRRLGDEVRYGLDSSGHW